MGSPVERLRERSREERKETISSAKYKIQDRMHEKLGRIEWGERRKRKLRTNTEEAAVRQL